MKVRRGLTLVELLVVIAIIGLLVALLMPAILSARESGRRTQCVNNLRQIGLAFIHHHESFTRFPYGQYGGYANNSALPAPPAPTPSASITWPIHILPFAEQRPQYDIIYDWIIRNPTKVAYGAWSDPARPANTLVPLPLYICPSDPNGGTPHSYFEGFQGNYLACNGSTVFWTGATGSVVGAKNTGVVLAGAQISIAHIRDGASNTLLASETMQWVPGDHRHGRMLNGYQGETFFSTLYTPNTAAADTQYSCGSGLPAHLPCTATASGANPVLTPRSYHAGMTGVNVAMCDGAVRFVTNTVDPIVWTAAGTRAGNDTVDLP